MFLVRFFCLENSTWISLHGNNIEPQKLQTWDNAAEPECDPKVPAAIGSVLRDSR